MADNTKEYRTHDYSVNTDYQMLTLPYQLINLSHVQSIHYLKHVFKKLR